MSESAPRDLTLGASTPRYSSAHVRACARARESKRLSPAISGYAAGGALPCGRSPQAPGRERAAIFLLPAIFALAALAAGWIVARARLRRLREHRTGTQPVPPLRPPHRTEGTQATKSHQHFLAGVALGIGGNAIISVVPEVIDPGATRLIFLTAVALVCVAYADSALRGAGLVHAIFESFVLVSVAASYFLVVVLGMRLSGLCEFCPAQASTVLVAFAYWAAGATVYVIARLTDRVMSGPAKDSLPSRIAEPMTISVRHPPDLPGDISKVGPLPGTALSSGRLVVVSLALWFLDSHGAGRKNSRHEDHNRHRHRSRHWTGHDVGIGGSGQGLLYPLSLLVNSAGE